MDSTQQALLDILNSNPDITEPGVVIALRERGIEMTEDAVFWAVWDLYTDSSTHHATHVAVSRRHA